MWSSMSSSFSSASSGNTNLLIPLVRDNNELDNYEDYSMPRFIRIVLCIICSVILLIFTIIISIMFL